MKVSGDIAPFGLRMPDFLKQFIEYHAGKSGRSMNAEVLSRIAETITSGEAIDFIDSLDAPPTEIDHYAQLFAHTYGVKINKDAEASDLAGMIDMKLDDIKTMVSALKLKAEATKDK